jgi:hypothetical protein
MFRRLIAWLKSLFKKSLPPVDYTMPKTLRSDLIYCYYGNMPSESLSQLEETKDHITHHFITPWSGVPYHRQLDEVSQEGKKAIVALWDMTDDEVRSFLFQSKILFLEQTIGMLYLWDEPNLPNAKITPEELARRVAFTRGLIKELEMPWIKLACIYADNSHYPCKELFDHVGINNYDKREKILVDGTYESLNLDYSWQKLIVVVGGWGANKQDPLPFAAYAHKHPEVGMFMPFVWFDNADQTTHAGIRSVPHRPDYVAVGRQIVTGS